MTEQKQALFTIFGATGDLAKRKLYPSLFRLFKKGELADNFAVIGTARRPWTNEYYREVVLESIKDLMNSKTEAEFITSSTANSPVILARVCMFTLYISS